MSKLTGSDSIQDGIVKMCEGNPGAITAIMGLLTEGEKIDPDDAFGGFGKLLLLDSFKIYGSNIYIIWNDICNRNTRDFCMVLRACQSGFMDVSELKNQIQNGGGIPFSNERWVELNNIVCDFLPKFMKAEK